MMIFLFQSMPNATHGSHGVLFEAFGYLEKENITFWSIFISISFVIGRIAIQNSQIIYSIISTWYTIKVAIVAIEILHLT